MKSMVFDAPKDVHVPFPGGAMVFAFNWIDLTPLSRKLLPHPEALLSQKTTWSSDQTRKTVYFRNEIVAA